MAEENESNKPGATDPDAGESTDAPTQWAIRATRSVIATL